MDLGIKRIVPSLQLLCMCKCTTAEIYWGKYRENIFEGVLKPNQSNGNYLLIHQGTNQRIEVATWDEVEQLLEFGWYLFDPEIENETEKIQLERAILLSEMNYKDPDALDTNDPFWQLSESDLEYSDSETE